MPDRFVDPVVAQIHAIRAEMLEAAGDIAELMKRVADHQRQARKPIVREPFRVRSTKPDIRKHEDEDASRRG